MAGYQKNFLGAGVELPLPRFSPSLAGNVLTSPMLRNGSEADYVNYTLVMNRVRRSPILVALNIDQDLLKSVGRTDDWKIDSRIGDDFQLNNDYYRSNPWDRGHMARRASAAWGVTSREAKRASDETFYYSNSCLQHANFNQDEWLALEDWVADLQLDSNNKITSFSGPIYGDHGRTVEPPGRPLAVVPAAFFKVVCFINKSEELEVRAFIMYQDNEAIADKSGRNVFDFQRYQVTVTEIEELTGIEFADEIYEKNPLLFYENEEAKKELNISHFPEKVEVDGPEEMVGVTSERDYFADDEVPVFIAAAMVNPEGPESEKEWVSIINLCPEEIDLDGWTLSDTKRKPLELGDVLQGQERRLRPGEAVQVGPVAPLMLSNKGGTIVLYDKPTDEHPQGRRIDRVTYPEEAGERQGRPMVFAYRRD